MVFLDCHLPLPKVQICRQVNGTEPTTTQEPLNAVAVCQDAANPQQPLKRQRQRLAASGANRGLEGAVRAAFKAKLSGSWLPTSGAEHRPHCVLVPAVRATHRHHQRLPDLSH